MITRLRLAVAALCALAVLAFAPGALASTLNEADGTVTWTAAPGVSNSTSFSDTSTAISIDTSDDPVTYSGGQPSASCIDSDGTVDGSASTVTCTGVSTIVANSGDNGDYADAGGLHDHPITINGEAGNDALFGGTQNDTLNGGDGLDWAAGGPGNDTIDVGAGNDDGAAGGPGNDTIRGSDGNDGALYGGPGDDNVDGGAGDDTVYGDCGDQSPCGAGTDGSDTVTGGAGDDSVFGDGGNDIVDGGAGDDGVFGDSYYESNSSAGNDTLTGGDGSDYLAPGYGSDSSNGGAGDDWIYEEQDNGADADAGGDGFDAVEYDTNGAGSGDVVNASLDGQANDGVVAGAGSSTTSDSGNDFGSTGSGIEQLNVYTGSTPVNASGDAGPSQINVYSNGSAKVDPGAGADTVNTGNGDDTISAVDGYPDTINCGPGNDTANVDQFDTTYNCEAVNRSATTSAYEDAPPSVSWITPTPGTHGVSSAAATTFEVAASDDRGISKVEFYVGSRLVCTATATPYRCSYLPRGIDMGRNTLSAVAYDTSGQTASALNQIIVPRFSVRSLSARTTPSKAARFPFRFTTSGKVTLPATVGPAEGCKGGFVTVQFRAGKKTISSRRVGLKPNCTYKSAVTFRIPTRLHPKRLNVLVRFGGNGTLNPKSAKTLKVRVF